MMCCILIFSEVYMCVQMSVGPVLATCKQLASSSIELAAVALRMMSSLWKQHDFCFPYLVQMLMSTTSVADADDGAVLLARAACMMDVCRLRFVEPCTIVQLSVSSSEKFVPKLIF